METAAAGATDIVKGGRLRSVIIISSYMLSDVCSSKCSTSTGPINSLLCPMQIHWFFKEGLTLVLPLNSGMVGHKQLEPAIKKMAKGPEATPSSQTQ